MKPRGGEAGDEYAAVGGLGRRGEHGDGGEWSSCGEGVEMEVQGGLPGFHLLQSFDCSSSSSSPTPTLDRQPEK